MAPGGVVASGRGRYRNAHDAPRAQRPPATRGRGELKRRVTAARQPRPAARSAGRPAIPATRVRLPRCGRQKPDRNGRLDGPPASPRPVPGLRSVLHWRRISRTSRIGTPPRAGVGARSARTFAGIRNAGPGHQASAPAAGSRAPPVRPVPMRRPKRESSKWRRGRTWSFSGCPGARKANTPGRARAEFIPAGLQAMRRWPRTARRSRG